MSVRIKTQKLVNHAIDLFHIYNKTSITRISIDLAVVDVLTMNKKLGWVDEEELEVEVLSVLMKYFL